MITDADINVAVIYYSQTGTVHALAEAATEGAVKSGAEVRLRRVKELAPDAAISSKPEWRKHLEEVADVPMATLDDLVWADAVLLGTPTRYGTTASQLQQFIDTTGPIWQQGNLSDKVYSAFTASLTAHGGQESTLLVLNHVFTHWGGIIVPPGYTDPIQFQVGNPYGASYVSAGTVPDDVHLEAARYQAQRVIEVARLLKRGRAAA
jgi:NAD(P)H dehydrogenase (quinone)